VLGASAAGVGAVLAGCCGCWSEPRLLVCAVTLTAKRSRSELARKSLLRCVIKNFTFNLAGRV
jgi:hypothetical protein